MFRYQAERIKSAFSFLSTYIVM